MDKINLKRIALLPWPNKENCFLILSGRAMKKDQYGDKWYAGHVQHVQNYHARLTSEPNVTFTYIGEKCAAEWDGEYGPIQMWYKCEKDYKNDFCEAREHWIYPYAYGAGHWSQMAVDENHLSESFTQGDYDHIFNVLKRFVDSRENENDR